MSAISPIIQDIFNRLDDSPSSRWKLFSDLKPIIRDTDYSASFSALKDKDWHLILNSLLEGASSEKATFLKTSSKSSKSSSRTHLSAYGEALRAITEVCSNKIRLKTVRNLLEYVPKTLFSEDHGLFEPLAIDYLRSLSNVLEYQPHVEHLRNEWHKILAFCIDSINFNCALEADASGPWATVRSSVTSTFVSGERHKRSVERSSELDELLVCTKHLCQPPSVPLYFKGDEITNALVAYFQTTPTLSNRGHLAAMRVLNLLGERLSYTNLGWSKLTVSLMVPILSKLWAFKSPPLCDEIVIFLTHTHLYIATLLKDQNNLGFREAVDRLLETIQDDYASRLSRDQLEFEAILLENTNSPDFPSLKDPRGFQLSYGRVDSEAQWATVFFIAYLSIQLDLNQSSDRGDHSNGGTSRKRHRGSNRLSNILRAIGIGQPARQVAAFQTLAFIASILPLSQDQLADLIDRISPLISGMPSSISCWAFLVLCQCAYQKESHSAELSQKWLQIWELAARLVPSSGSCRAACHVLDTLLRLKLVPYSSVSQFIDSMLEVSELSGPAILTESSISLWISSLSIRISENPSSSRGLGEKLLQWLFKKWTPSFFDDRFYSTQASRVRAFDILRLLSFTTDGQFLSDYHSIKFPRGIIAQSWARFWDSHEQIQYLLLVPMETPFLVQDSFRPTNLLAQSKRDRTVDDLLLGTSVTEMENIVNKLPDFLMERKQGFTISVLRLLTTTCIVNDHITAIWQKNLNPRVSQLNALTATISEKIVDYLGSTDCDQSKVDEVLLVTRSLLSNPVPIALLDKSQLQCLRFAIRLAKIFESRKSGTKSQIANIDMDIDDGFESQASQIKSDQVAAAVGRDYYSLEYDISCFRLNSELHLSYLFSLVDNDLGQSIPQSFFDQLFDLSPTESAITWPFLFGLLKSSSSADDVNVSRLLELISDEYLNNYAYERCEAVLASFVKILELLAEKWADSESISPVRDISLDIYKWFLGTFLEKRPASAHVVKSFMHLAFKLLEIQGPQFQPSDSIDTIQASILKLLGSEISIRWSLAQHLPRLFDHFTLGEHETLFQEIYNQMDPDEWLEGMALFMFMQAQLASSWSTLQRQGIYRIFEWAGLFPPVIEYASFCMERIGSLLNLRDAKELFHLYSAQMLYTWMDSRDLLAIPYAVFGYDSLSDFLRDVEDEITGQIIARGTIESIETLSSELALSTQALIENNFSRAVAYSFCLELPKDMDPKSTGEARIKKVLGVEKYVQLLQTHYARILAIVVGCIRTSDEESLIKALTKDQSTASVGAVLNTIRNTSHSNIQQVADQQPTFRSINLLETLRRICRRTGREYGRLWNPALYVFVLRSLLIQIHPSLGSLHACAVIRKIRVFIALTQGSFSGGYVDGYPLEMTLSSLQPFLTDPQCAEDTIGLVQHLLESAGAALCTNIAFVCGFVVTSLVSLRKFINTPQDSTTQESHHRTIMNRAGNFREWLVRDWCSNYAQLYQNGKGKGSHLDRFQAIVNAASHANAKATAKVLTSESVLLKELLLNRKADQNIIKPATDASICALFLQDFDNPPSYREDFLGTDVESFQFSNEVLNITREVKGLNNQFFIWAGRVLGRANNYRSLPQSSSRSSKYKVVKPDDPDNLCEVSIRAIIRIVTDILPRGSRTDAGLVEDFLRSLAKQGYEQSLEFVPEFLPILRVGANDPVIPISSQIVPVETVSQDYTNASDWVKDLAISLSASSKNVFIRSLSRILSSVQGVAEKIFAPMVHILLSQEFESGRAGQVHSKLSKIAHQTFSRQDESSLGRARVLLDLILHLRLHDLPKDYGGTIRDRDRWLDLDYVVVARTAEACGMHAAALLFAESAVNTALDSSSNGRRKSAPTAPALPEELLMSIYKNIDEPDSFYGVHQNTSLTSVMERLDYENDGFKALLFHGAKLDSTIRRVNEVDTSGVLQAFSQLNLNGVTHALLQANSKTGSKMVNQALQAAQKLEQWDINVPDSATSNSAILFNVFQSLNNSLEFSAIQDRLGSATTQILQPLLHQDLTTRSIHASFRSLGVLEEVDEVMSCRSLDQLREVLDRMHSRDERMATSQVDSLKELLSCRETLFGIIAGNRNLQNMLHLTERDAMETQVEILLRSCRLSQDLNMASESLSTVTYLADLVPTCERVGLNVRLQVQEAIADILWAQEEQAAAIQILSSCLADESFKQPNSGKTAAILAKLGHHVGEARLENPEEITQKYLEPALKDLKGHFSGQNAGQVLHEFAVFCDIQLSNEEFSKDFERVTNARERRRKEVEAYQNLIRSSKTKQDKDKYNREYKISKRWYDLDDEEFNRMTAIRDTQVLQCLENYLRSLQAWDNFDSDVLRFFSIWLENAENVTANSKAASLLPLVPTRKFAILMNQLSSILQNDQSVFTKTLKRLILSICVDHPYHSLHHIFAGSHLIEGSDTTTTSRHKAIVSIADSLNADKTSRDTWQRMYKADTMYHKLAMYKDKSKALAAGRQVILESLSPSATLKVKIKDLVVPPATMNIPLRHDKNYKDLPHVIDFLPTMTIASGISAPKILTAITSDGKHYKQLYKGGNDDLRQDAIMEQVFEQVSHLLRNHAPTRQRRLHIRTYKVLPLSPNSGIMEFVKNTIPLSDYLHPAHEKYYPANYSWSRCRELLSGINNQTKDPKSILKVYKEIASQFNPVLQFFFFERFLDPDEWFKRRLAYTRSTAAISMLGHILGLGDRHCHNILLDQQTGEAVHIDLGIAFEAGRILPVPEVVPFRLTRDIVSAMGYTKTNGVFKRCCEFTLDALREERENIMTLLNVLRFDPLVNWTVSPLRARRMQEQEAGEKDFGVDTPQSSGPGGKNKDEGGHAGRALRVVEKKLSKVSSTAATVNELIQQATDERNLAVLYPGWAPWA